MYRTSNELRNVFLRIVKDNKKPKDIAKNGKR